MVQEGSLDREDYEEIAELAQYVEANGLWRARQLILARATETLGEEMLAMLAGEACADPTWNVVAIPAVELPVPELPDDLIGAERVTRVKDARGDKFRCVVS